MNTVLRSIVCQFIHKDRHETPCNFECESATSVNHIDSLGYSRVVLIVDELNRFELPLDLGLSTFFKVHFLDKENFYLVFSSHQPLDIEAIRIAMSSSHSLFGLAPAADAQLQCPNPVRSQLIWRYSFLTLCI